MEIPDEIVYETIELIKQHCESLPDDARLFNAERLLKNFQDIVQEELDD